MYITSSAKAIFRTCKTFLGLSMMNEKSYIRIKYFPDFKGKESLIISADIKGLLELEEVFWQLSDDRDNYDFSNLKLLDKEFDINLSAFKGMNDVGLKRNSTGTFEWIVTKEKWGHFRERLTGLYRIGSDGSRTLNADQNHEEEIQVIFSWN